MKQPRCVDCGTALVMASRTAGVCPNCGAVYLDFPSSRDERPVGLKVLRRVER